LCAGFALFIVAMITWPTRATAVSSPPIIMAAIGNTATPDPIESADPLHDPFMDYYSEFADPTAPTPAPTTNPVTGRTPAFDGGSSVPAQVNVCLTFGSMSDRDTVPYAILESGGGRQYVTIGDNVGQATVSKITFDAVVLSDGRRLTRDGSHCGAMGAGGDGGSRARRSDAGRAVVPSGPAPAATQIVPPFNGGLITPAPRETLTPIESFGARPTPAPRSNDIYNPIDPKTPYMAPGSAPTPPSEGSLTPL
jgi:hypothetical protein